MFRVSEEEAKWISRLFIVGSVLSVWKLIEIVIWLVTNVSINIGFS